MSEVQVELSKALKVGAIWKRKSKAGNDYMSGMIEKQKLIEAIQKAPNDQIRIMLTNNKSENPKAPTFHIVCTEVEYQKSEQQAQTDGIPF